VLKLLGPALRKINVDPQDLDGATIAELTERCATAACRQLAVGSLQSRLTSSHAMSCTDAAAADLPFFRPRLSDCSLGTWLLCSISKGIVGTSLVGISSMGGGEERFRQAAEAGRSPKPDEGLLPRP